MIGKKYRKKRMLMVTIGEYDHASSRVRAIQYIPLLENNANYSVKWIPRIPRKPKTRIERWLIFPIKKRYLWLKRTYNLIFKDWDIIFIQKIFISNLILKSINKKGTSIIYDFDDAIYINRKSQQSNEEKTSQMIKAASKVIVSTTHLIPFCEKYGVNPIVITSSVDTQRIKPRKKRGSELVTVGWIGSSWTTDFLYDIYDSLLKISENLNFKILVVGAKTGFNLKGLRVESEKWSLEKEADLLNKMDIGIMPLPATDYAIGKGGYKLFLYMAAGKPIVASSVGINTEIIKHGENGFLVNNQEDWIAYLSQLIKDKPLRDSMGKLGRKNIEEQYSLNVCFKKLISIIET